ncbi:MAG: efflux RND transporter periplasmic adaptor subunit [Patescibacteria group bacterium]
MVLKKFLQSRKKLLGSALLLVFAAFVVVGCGAASDSTDTTEQNYVPQVETVLVAPGLSREIATTGEVEAAKSATLTAETRADVKNVFVKVGGSVNAGQILIQLNSASVSSTRSTAGAAYVNAQNSLTQTQLTAQKSVESAQVALETAQIALTNTLAQNEALRSQAEEALAAAKLSSGLSVSSAQTGLDNAISAVYPVADSAVAACDAIIGVSPAYASANDSFEDFLGALKFGSKSLAENAILDALNALQMASQNYDSSLTILRAAETATTKTLDVLNNSTTGAAFSQASLNADIAAINAKISTVRGAISTLNSAKSALDSAEQNSNGTSQSVLSAEAAYRATLTQLASNEKSARQSVESAKAGVATAQKSAALTRSSAKASLDAVAGNLSQAQISQNKLRITAPFAGKVTAVEVDPGDEVSAGAVLVRVEDASTLKIVAHLSAEEVRKISVGDEVKIATQSADKVSAISPSADPITKKFEVEILHQNPYLQAGSFVKLRFEVGESNAADQRIFLPLTAINILASGNFVWVVEDGKAVKKTVELGALEGEFVEIKSGLELNQEVIVSGGRVLDDAKDGIAVEVK